MKKLLISLFATMALFACSKSEEVNPEITLETDSASFTEDGGSNIIYFTSTDAWTAESINNPNDVWCSVSPSNGSAGTAKITISATANGTTDKRTATVVIKSGTAEKSIAVMQDTAANKIIYTSSNGGVVNPDTTNVFGANIVSNIYNNGRGVITFDGNVTWIGNHAFYYCRSLTSITIPNSVTSIGNYAFYYCDNLTNVTIPDSVTSISDYAFPFCIRLTSITIPDSVTIIGDEAFNACKSLTSITIPNGVTLIGNGVFMQCSSLTSVTIPDSVTSIGNNAFAYCESLTSVTIPNRVTSIGREAFADCKSLTSVTIPNSVTSIGYGAFWNCKSLTSITIPNNVTQMGDNIFWGCNNLKIVYCKPQIPPTLEYGAFYNCASNLIIYVPSSSVDAYKSAYEWKYYADKIVGYDFSNE